MPKKRYPAEQIIRHLREAEVELAKGQTIGEVCRKLGITEQFRDEFLNGEIFYTLREAKVLIEGWRWEYNKVRPHSALGYRPPAPEGILPLPPGSAPLHPAATAYGLTWKVDQ